MMNQLPFGFTWARRGVWMNLKGYEIHVNDMSKSYRLIYMKDFRHPLGKRFRSLAGAAKAAEKHFKSLQ